MGKARQETLKFLLLFLALSLMKDYALLLHRQVIYTQKGAERVSQDIVCQTPNCSARHAFHYS